MGRSIAEKVTEPKETRRTKKVPVVAARSEAIIDELRGGLGESSFLSVLNIVLQEIRPTLRMQQSEDQDASRLRAANAARVASTRAAILAQSVNSDAAGAFISRTRPVVNKLARAGEILAIRDGRYLRFPRWQFDRASEDGLVPGLRRILAVMDASPFRKAAWLVSPNVRFKNRAPIELLREGRSDRVYEEAKSIVGS